MMESGDENLLIFVPHADDEVLGCGGLIEKACRLGNKVKVILATAGETTFYHSGQTVAAETREQEFGNALRILGCGDYEIMYRDKESYLDTIPRKELITRLDQYICDFRPSMVFLPYPSFHQDHQALFHACMASLRLSLEKRIKLIAMYEYPYIVWQYPRVHDAGELYLDITKTVDLKIEALLQHRSQIRREGHMLSPETVKQWAKMRGMEIGFEYAEKFHLLRATLL